MGQWAARKERFEKILRQIMADGDYCLSPHMTSIDPGYYTRELDPDEMHGPRDPHPLFDSTWYQAVYLSSSYPRHPFCHFMTHGYKQGNKPSAYFDYDVYAARTGWDKNQGNPLRHYLKDNRHNQVAPGVFFDRGWYCDKTPILLDHEINALINYRLFGTREEKSPVPVFDPRYYLDQLTPEQRVLAAKDPFSHYASFGTEADLKPCEWFDPKYYRKQHMGKASVSPLEHYLREGAFQGFCADSRVEEIQEKPIFSIVVPVYNVAPHYLNNCIRSVLYQSYPHWELCLADDGSTRKETVEQLESWKKLGDARVKVIFTGANRGIAAATNSAAALARGDYIAFLDNDDELTPDCLFQTARRIADTGAELVYSDEALTGVDGRRLSLFLKPDFNRALLLSHNYITHFVAVSRELFEKCGGVNSACDGAQDFDFLLRATELAHKIEHIPKVLYHWRAAETSVSADNDQKPYAHNAGKIGLENYLKHRGIKGNVHDTDLNFFYRINRSVVPPLPLVTILVWNTENRMEKISDTLRKIRQSAGYENYEIVLIGGGSENPYSQTDYGEITLFPQEHNKAKSLNAAINRSKADYIALLDSSADQFEDRWLHELVSIARSEQVHIVCGRAEYGDEPYAFQTVPDISSTDIHYYYRFLHTATIHLNGLHCTQYVTLPTTDICLFSKDLYSRVQGFDHDAFPAMFTLADFAFQAADLGHKVFYTPYARVLYPARPLADIDKNLLDAEKDLFCKKWSDKLRTIGKYYNPGVLSENAIDTGEFIRWQAGDRSPFPVQE